MKSVRIFFYNRLSEKSFLSKKLKIRNPKNIILGKQYKLIDPSDFVFDRSNLSININVIDGPIPDRKTLLSQAEPNSKDTVIIHFSGTFVAAGIESIQSWRSELLRFIERNDTCGAWLVTSSGFKKISFL